MAQAMNAGISLGCREESRSEPKEEIANARYTGNADAISVCGWAFAVSGIEPATVDEKSVAISMIRAP
jgi:hypothetical protein